MNDTARVRDLLDTYYLWVVATKASLESSYLDLSETHARIFRGKGSVPQPEKIPTLTKMTEIYSYQHDRTFIAEEYGNLFGLGQDRVRELVKRGAEILANEAEFKELLRNTMVLPHIGLVMLSGMDALGDLLTERE